MNPHYENFLQSDLLEYSGLVILGTDPESSGWIEYLKTRSGTVFIDLLESQASEWVKLKNAHKKLSGDSLLDHTRHFLQDQGSQFGNFVWYKWKNTLIKILPKQHFSEVRTARNLYKITPEERDALAHKKVGIAGLSVGSTVAWSIALERSAGELRLADFDTLELSNLNRIIGGLTDIGLNKAIISARAIAELDPYIKVKVFTKGLIQEEMDAFFNDGGKLDVFIDECDSLDIKIESRFKAKELGIPVIMETNDRAMVDIERFDLEPQREILHGLAKGLNPNNLKGLTTEEKLPFVLAIVGAATMSTRLKSSMMEIDASITGWPQLGSHVMYGGGLLADVYRKVALGLEMPSGRFYADPDTCLIPFDVNQLSPLVTTEQKFEETYSWDYLHRRTDDFLKGRVKGFEPHQERIDKMMEMACLAPSVANNQPWRWIYASGHLILFAQDYSNVSEWGDYKDTFSLQSLGSSFENVFIAANALGLEFEWEVLGQDFPGPVAYLRFTGQKQELPEQEWVDLIGAIPQRMTNRAKGARVSIDEDIFQFYRESVKSFHGIRFDWVSNENDIHRLAEIGGTLDRIRLLTPEMHKDFYQAEVRWPEAHRAYKNDGFDMENFQLKSSDLWGMKLASDWNSLKLLHDLNLGKNFDKLSKEGIELSSAAAVITVPELTVEKAFSAGRALERIWLWAALQNVGIHPFGSMVYFFLRDKFDALDGLKIEHIGLIKSMHSEFNQIFGLGSDRLALMFLKFHKTPIDKYESKRHHVSNRYQQHP